jgi:hypothetical protein
VSGDHVQARDWGRDLRRQTDERIDRRIIVVGI